MVNSVGSSQKSLLWLESPTSQPVVTGQGACVVFSGVASRAGANLRSVQLCFEEQAPIDIPCGFARDDLAAQWLEDSSEQHNQSGPSLPATPELRRLGVESGGFWYSHGVRHAVDELYTIKATFTDGEVVQLDSLTLSLQKNYHSHFCADAQDRRLMLADRLRELHAEMVVCMATYRPARERLKRQVNSLRNQSYENWVCIICDDGSDEESIAMIRASCGDDQRFLVVTHSHNIGFYRNFERALHYVPDDARYVALSDQDDLWYPEKLQTLVGRLEADSGQEVRQDSMLVYSDMRVVDVDGGVISNTYWRNRRNNFKDPDVVLLANTVTGAACVMQSQLLKLLLPFPEPIGDAFHDHWMACCALGTGTIQYVDQPLYDYFQYDDSVIGHSDFAVDDVNQGTGGPGHADSSAAVGVGVGVKKNLIHYRASGLAVHHQECRRIELIISTLKLRIHNPTARAKRAWRLFGNGAWSGLRLLVRHISIRLRGQTTNHAEVRLGLGYLINSLDHMRLRLGRKLRFLGKSRRAGQSESV